MAISLKHNFTSSKPDGTDSTMVQPSNWNAEHTLTQATNKLLGRTTASTGATEEISVGSNLSFSSLSLNLASSVSITALTSTSLSAGAATFTGTDSVKMAAGTVAQRVSTSAGAFRFNTDYSKFEGYNGTSWNSVDMLGYQTITSGTGDVTLTNVSPKNIFVSGTSTQNIILPNVTTLQLGWSVNIISIQTAGSVTVKSSDGTAFSAGNLAAGMTGQYFCIAITGTGTSSWAPAFDGAATYSGSGALVFNSAPSISNATLNGSITEAVYAVSGTTPALSAGNGTIQTWTLTGNSTPTSSLTTGQSITLMINDGTAYTITWPSVTWVNNAASAPSLATTGYTVVALWNVAGTLYGALVGNQT